MHIVIASPPDPSLNFVACDDVFVLRNGWMFRGKKFFAMANNLCPLNDLEVLNSVDSSLSVGYIPAPSKRL